MKRTPQQRHLRLALADASTDVQSGDTTGLVYGPGECVQCQEHAAERIVVGMVAANSGPGWTKYGCLPCARRLAEWKTAPDWLSEDLARLDAARATR